MLDPFFHTCLAACLQDRDFIEGFDRLTGSCLALHKLQPIEQMVDRATGRTEESVQRFVDFVYQTVYLRVSG